MEPEAKEGCRVRFRWETYGCDFGEIDKSKSLTVFFKITAKTHAGQSAVFAEKHMAVILAK